MSDNTMFDIEKICKRLDSLYAEAKRNELPPISRRAFASGQLHDELARIIRRWQYQKEDELHDEEIADSIAQHERAIEANPGY